MQQILQEEVKKLQAVNQKIQKLAEPRNTYMTQLAENEGVIKVNPVWAIFLFMWALF